MRVKDSLNVLERVPRDGRDCGHPAPGLCRHKSAVFTPASCSFRIAMICSSVGLFRFIVRSPRTARIPSNSLVGQGHYFSNTDAAGFPRARHHRKPPARARRASRSQPRRGDGTPERDDSTAQMRQTRRTRQATDSKTRHRGRKRNMRIQPPRVCAVPDALHVIRWLSTQDDMARRLGNG
jgi:hypothetical protein